MVSTFCIAYLPTFSIVFGAFQTTSTKYSIEFLLELGFLSLHLALDLLHVRNLVLNIILIGQDYLDRPDYSHQDCLGILVLIVRSHHSFRSDAHSL